MNCKICGKEAIKFTGNELQITAGWCGKHYPDKTEQDNKMKTIRVYYFNGEQKIVLYTATAKDEDIKRFIKDLSRGQRYEFI